MTNRIRAVYEKGVFRPSDPVQLQEGERVELVFETPSGQPDPAALVAALVEISSLPVESPRDGFSEADHDEVLYGGDDAR